MDSLTDEQREQLKTEAKKPSSEVFVKNIDFKVTSFDLKHFCELNFGPVTKCVIKVHEKGNRRGQSKGLANVLFQSLVAANNMVLAAQSRTLLLRQRQLVVHSVPYRDAELFHSQTVNQFPLASLRMGSWATPNQFVYVTELESFFQLSCTLGIRKRRITITYEDYTLELSFKDLSTSLILEQSETGIIVYMNLKRTPRIFRKIQRFIFLSYANEEDEYERVCDFTEERAMEYCSVYQLTFSSEFPDLRKALLDLARYNLTTEPLKFAPRSSVQYRSIETHILDSFLEELPFNLRFKVESLINMWKIPDPRIIGLYSEFHRFFRFLLANAANSRLDGALDLMAYLEDPIIFNIASTLKKCFENARPMTVDKDFMLVYRVLITPTKTILIGPEMEVSNRVIRQYQQYSNNFIRVSFVDENLAMIFGNQFSDKLGARCKAKLSEGIEVAGKKYSFLAYSSSQLREHGCWFVAPFDGQNADTIRSWMGDFSGNKNVAKCAARMGQCFSTTFETAEVPPLDIKRIPDIKTADEQYTFSDGIGQISEKFARDICASKLALSNVPSAFQCRIGGCKGMVAINPRANHKLYIRPSMEKFKSPHTVFEVIGTSHFIPSYLNRQIIMLLSNLGIPDSVFEHLQDNMVRLLNSMLREDLVAKSMLTSMPDQHDFSATALKMLKGGFSVLKEPFLHRLMKAMHTKRMRDIKSKARIFLKESVCLNGVLDETKTLKYGQVFLRINRPGDPKNPQVIQGRVFVVKNPAFHPGDIRVLEAVDCPSLYHLVDCLVFPQTGPRPHPSETSGSDLDGDIYTICWDPNLVPLVHKAPGMYEPPPPIMKDKVEIADIHDFFVSYMKNDILGIIANTHMAIADASPKGPNDPKCLQLTELHSTAVDYPKTGVPATLPLELRVHPNVGYPDFMEKKGRNEYKSPKILGILFRKIHPTTLPDLPLTFDHDLVVEGHEEYLEEAENLKKEYNFRIISLMNQFGVKSEAELISGCVVKVGKQFLKKNFFDHIQRMCQAVYALKREFRVQFEEGLTGIPPEDLDYHRKAKASAWYVVMYSEEYRKKESGEKAKALLGLPWIMVDHLVKIKKEKVAGRTV